MKNIKEITILLGSVALIFVIGLMTAKVNFPSVGSVVDAGTYSFTNITSANASSTSATTVLSKGGTLGSVIINTTHATIIRVYDGTATSTGTLIASFPASAVVGTYTFDVAVSKGVVVDIPSGFAGNYTITAR
jgi:hypothetical protein